MQIGTENPEAKAKFRALNPITLFLFYFLLVLSFFYCFAHFFLTSLILMQIGKENPKGKAKFENQQMPVVMQNVSFKPKKSSNKNIKTQIF